MMSKGERCDRISFSPLFYINRDPFYFVVYLLFFLRYIRNGGGPYEL